MPATSIPPCPDNWQPCDFCGAGPEETCKYPDSKTEGRRMPNPRDIVCGYRDVPSRQWCGSSICADGGCIANGKAVKVNAAPTPSADFEVKVDLPPRHYIPQDANARKQAPMARALLDYFPAALFAVAAHSALANLKHNPGQSIRWTRGKSNDHADCIIRHLVERGQVEDVELPDGTVIQLRASAAGAWRYLALLQEELEAEGAAPGRAADFSEQDGRR